MENKTAFQKFNRAFDYSSLVSFKVAIVSFLAFISIWAFGWLKIEKLKVDGEEIKKPNSFKNATTVFANSSLSIWAVGTFILLLLCAFGLVNNRTTNNNNN